MTAAFPAAAPDVEITKLAPLTDKRPLTAGRQLVVVALLLLRLPRNGLSMDRLKAEWQASKGKFFKK